MATYNNFKSTTVCGNFYNSDYADGSILANGHFDRDLTIKGNIYLGTETSTTDASGNITYTDTNGNIKVNINGILYTITPTLLSYITGLTSSAQTQINNIYTNPHFSQYIYLNNNNGAYPTINDSSFLAIGSNFSSGHGEGNFVNVSGIQTASLMAFNFSKLLTTTTKSDLFKIFNNGTANLLGTLTCTDITTTGTNPITSLNTSINSINTQLLTIPTNTTLNDYVLSSSLISTLSSYLLSSTASSTYATITNLNTANTNITNLQNINNAYGMDATNKNITANSAQFAQYIYLNNTNGTYPNIDANNFLAIGSNLSSGQAEGNFINTASSIQGTSMAFNFSKLLSSSTKSDLLQIKNNGDATLLGSLTCANINNNSVTTFSNTCTSIFTSPTLGLSNILACTITTNPNYNKSITLNIPLSVYREYYNTGTPPSQFFNQITETLTSVSYIINKNDTFFTSGTCNSNNALPITVTFQQVRSNAILPSPNSHVNYEVYMTNVSLSFNPTIDTSTDIYTIYLTMTYTSDPAMINPTQFVNVTNGYNVNTTVSTYASLGLTSSGPSPLTFIYSTSNGIGYSYPSGYAFPNTYNSGNGEVQVNQLTSNTINNQGNINSNNIYCNNNLYLQGCRLFKTFAIYNYSLGTISGNSSLPFYNIPLGYSFSYPPIITVTSSGGFCGECICYMTVNNSSNQIDALWARNTQGNTATNVFCNIMVMGY